VVPIVNENDAVVNEEIRFGDNDTLAALATNLVEAEYLVILTDQEGLYESDPRTSDGAQLVSRARAGDPALLEMAGGAGDQGSGGMLTKIRAAEKAAGSGAKTVIVSGKQSDVLRRLRDGEDLGTLILPGSERIAARKQWLAGQLRGNGILVLDSGAVSVLRESGRSLLPIGVVAGPGNVFPREWKRAWYASYTGDERLMAVYQDIFQRFNNALCFHNGGNVVEKAMACFKYALKLEGVIESDAVAQGTPGLIGDERRQFEEIYLKIKEEIKEKCPAKWISAATTL